MRKQASEHNKDNAMLSEIDLAVATLLASATLQFPELTSMLTSTTIQKLCCLMYSEGMKAGVIKCQEMLRDSTR